MIATTLSVASFAQTFTTSQVNQINNLITNALKNATTGIQNDYNAKLTTRDATIKILRDSVQLLNSKRLLLDTNSFVINGNVASLNVTQLSPLTRQISGLQKLIADNGSADGDLSQKVADLVPKVQALIEKNSPSAADFSPWKDYLQRFQLGLAGLPVK